MKEYFVRYATNNGIETRYFWADSKEELTETLDRLGILSYVITAYEEIYL